MPAPVPQNTTLDVLLLAAQSRIVGQNVVTASSCFIGLSPDDNVFPNGDQFIVITPGHQTVDRPVFEGAGRAVLLMKGEMSATIWCRLALDQTPQSTDFLTDTSLGVLVTFNSLVQNLLLYQPVDGSGNQLLPIGFEFKSVDTYTKKFDGVGWGAVMSQWAFDWTMAITETIP